MSYIGVQPKAGQYRKLDDISGGFNGSTATFNLTVSGQAVTAATAQQLMISLGGVIQNPGVDYTVSTNTITFTTNPASGLDFFGVLLGDAINTGTPSDGTVTTAKLASDLSVDLASGSAGTPSLTFDANSGLFSPANDEISISTNGGERFRVGSAGQLGIGGATYGTSGQVLTSAGSGSTPTWTTPTSLTNAEDGAGNNFEFNSGFGSNATAYGCRVWVNFDGTGSVSSNQTINGSGNVSSVWKNGTGLYTVNFANAMPDANYSVVAEAASGSTGNIVGNVPQTTQVNINAYTSTWATGDRNPICVAVFR